MRVFPLVVVLGMLCLASGCGEYWYQEGKTFDQCKQDFSACCAEKAEYNPDNRSLPYENKFISRCMKEKGYKRVTETKLPLRVKRQASTATPFEVANGFAGTGE